jgi:hypothetical protein
MASTWWTPEKKSKPKPKPRPSNLGTGGAAKAAKQLGGRKARIEKALKDAGA